MPDRAGAGTLRVRRGAIRFEGVRFGYGTGRGVLHGSTSTSARASGWG